MFNIQPLTASGSLTERVAETLIALIRNEEYPAKTRLPTQSELASRFGVSVTVIREAIARLKSEGIVEVRQGSGTFVREPSLDKPFRIDQSATDSLRSILQIVELRKCLESEISALAAEHATKIQIAHIRRTFKDMDRQVRGGYDGVEADLAFHRAIALASGNPHILALMEFIGQFLRGAMRVTRTYEARNTNLTTQVTQEHAEILKAIERHDPEGARASARRHMERVATRISSADSDFWKNEGGSMLTNAPSLTDPLPEPARRRRRRDKVKAER